MGVDHHVPQSLRAIAEDARTCQACPLWRNATQTVLGEGPDGAVKHFTWTPRGKRRIHAKPSVAETLACRPWLEVELERLDPAVLVVLGATALRSLLGSGHTVGAERGRVLRNGPVPATVVTVHPSSVLRGEPADRDAALAGLVADLRVAVAALPPA